MDLTNLNGLEIFLTGWTVFVILFTTFLPIAVKKDKGIKLAVSIVSTLISIAIFINVSLEFWLVFEVIGLIAIQRLENTLKGME